MNERIKALLLNARNMFVNGVTESDNKIYIHGSEENLEKFAELIVAECISILMKPGYAMNHPGELTDYNRGWVNGRLLGIEHIEGYFGVEDVGS
jgi:hypothetical protein